MSGIITPEHNEARQLGRERARALGKGGGMVVGTFIEHTISKKKTLTAISVQIEKKAKELVRAGLSVALGTTFIYKIDPTTKKSVVLTDRHEIARALDAMRFNESESVMLDNQYIYITTKEPDHKAIEMLLNRAFGKAKETIDVNTEVKFSLKNIGLQAEAMRRAREGVIVEPLLLPEVEEEMEVEDISPAED